MTRATEIPTCVEQGRRSPDEFESTAGLPVTKSHSIVEINNSSYIIMIHHRSIRDTTSIIQSIWIPSLFDTCNGDWIPMRMWQWVIQWYSQRTNEMICVAGHTTLHIKIVCQNRHPNIDKESRSFEPSSFLMNHVVVSENEGTVVISPGMLYQIYWHPQMTILWQWSAGTFPKMMVS